MNYLELLLHLQQQQEHILSHGVEQILTTTHRYLRHDDLWGLDTIPGTPEKKWGRGGEYYVWKADVDEEATA